MIYRIQGLDPARFAHLVGLPDAELAAHGVVRMTADAPTGFPCRVQLDDVQPGETVLLLNHVSHDGPNPIAPVTPFSSAKRRPKRLFTWTRSRQRSTAASSRCERSTKRA